MNSSNYHSTLPHNIPGGLVGKTTEFFTVVEEDRQHTKLFFGGKSFDFEAIPKCRETILKNKYQSLSNEKKNAYEVMARESYTTPLEKMTMCLFGALNHEPDIDENGNLSEPEYVPCPNRRDCKFQGVGCCSIMVGEVELSKAETNVFKLVQFTDEEIAEKLFVSKFTVHKHFTNIRLKTQFKDKKDMAVWAAKKGII